MNELWMPAAIKSLWLLFGKGFQWTLKTDRSVEELFLFIESMLSVINYDSVAHISKTKTDIDKTKSNIIIDEYKWLKKYISVGTEQKYLAT
jgi:uncharacterized protein YwgA